MLGDASIAGIAHVMAAITAAARSPVVAPFAQLQRLHVDIDPAALPALVALVPRITDLRLKLRSASAADFAALMQTLAPRLRRLAVGKRFLLMEAIVVLAAARAERLKCLDVVGK
jgi:hypothetical protein